VTALVTSCTAAPAAVEPTVAQSPGLPWPTEDWPTSTPEEQGLDSELLADMLDRIQQEDYSIDSVLVVRHGVMVLDATVYPFAPGQKHVIHSCTKSIVSALIGIAIDQGYIEGVEQSLLDLFPERTVANLDASKQAITLQDMLTMSSGLECRDSYLYRWRGLDAMRASSDWVQFMLDLPAVEKPGSRFEYCNGGSFLLSAIIRETTGLSALAFAEEHLFGPLGISDVTWPSNPQGISIGWGEMRMHPHDMAKIGYLYLNGGQWDGQQVVPAAWVAESTRQHIVARTLQEGYGYQWWIHPSGMYLALGYAGQYIAVVPGKDMVVVFTSDLPESQFLVPQELIDDFVLPAARSTRPLPANPKGLARLESRVEALTTP
jgi:CubicO group peptidase (beta-lactamase class C family)